MRQAREEEARDAPEEEGVQKAREEEARGAPEEEGVKHPRRRNEE